MILTCMFCGFGHQECSQVATSLLSTYKVYFLSILCKLEFGTLLDQLESQSSDLDNSKQMEAREVLQRASTVVGERRRSSASVCVLRETFCGLLWPHLGLNWPFGSNLVNSGHLGIWCT